MSLLDTYQEGTDTAVQFMTERPLEPPKPKQKWSGWSTLPRAVAAGVAEVGANVSDVLGASAQAYADFGMTQNPLETMTDTQRQGRNRAIEEFSPNFRPAQSRPLYEFSESMRVDPQTATVAESAFFGIAKGLTKAVAGAVAGGPIAAAATLGVSEGMTQAEDLANQGVDVATRTQVGALTGVLTGGSALLPVAGQTVKQTVALTLAGGPAAYMAQQKATSEILSRANYPDIAQQYDPLDPVGLTIATLIPAGFGIHAMKSVSRPTARQNAKADTNAPDAAEVQPGAQDAQPAPVKTQNFELQENVDVAMVQNLTIQRDVADSTPVAKFAADLSKQEVTENPNFKNWFGESKVVDPEGKPMVVYHGTTKDFDSFTPESHFGTDVQANSILKYNQRINEGNQAIFPVYLSMRNPKRVEDISGVKWADAVALAKSEGYDGLVYQNWGEFDPDHTGMPKDSYVVFDPRQIKSAIGNSGIFDPNSASLTDQIRTGTQQVDASRNNQSNPLEPGNQQQSPVIKQTIERIVAENPDMHVSVAEDGTRRTLKDEVEAVRREIAKGTDDELGTDDAKLVQAAIQCFLGG